MARTSIRVPPAAWRARRGGWFDCLKSPGLDSGSVDLANTRNLLGKISDNDQNARARLARERIADAPASSQGDEMLCLAITGFDADPDLVTELLQIEPTLVRRKGEVAGSGRAQTFNGWWREANEAPLLDGAQHDGALKVLLGHLRGREDRFAKLREQVRPESVTIYGGLHVPADQQCGIWLDPYGMGLLAACGVGWGLDLFIRE